jgi:bis(5'-nucleosidyl)-tetraphosphatase
MKTFQSAGIIVYKYQENRPIYLLLHYTAGHWDFPKGKIEAGETKEQAAHRELLEETGLQATITPEFQDSFSYLFTDHEGNRTKKTVYFFMGRALSTAVTLSEEHTGYVWLEYDQALAQLTYPNAQEALKKAHLFIEKDTYQ